MADARFVIRRRRDGALALTVQPRPLDLPDPQWAIDRVGPVPPEPKRLDQTARRVAYLRGLRDSGVLTEGEYHILADSYLEEP